MNTDAESPVRLSDTDTVSVLNGCLRVNGKPFLVESVEGEIVKVEGGFLHTRAAGRSFRTPVGDVRGAWA
jgi:hypothetical protein